MIGSDEKQTFFAKMLFLNYQSVSIEQMLSQTHLSLRNLLEGKT